MTDDLATALELAKAELDRAAPVVAAAIEVADADEAIKTDPSIDNLPQRLLRTFQAHTALVEAVKAWRGRG